MQCADFRDRLTAFLGDELSSEERELCEKHLTSCEECLETWLSKNGLDVVLSSESAQSLTTNILKSTKLDPCQTCEDMLCDFVDGSLGEQQRHFLKLHLDSCDECKNTAYALVTITEDLPLLATVEPTVDLTGAILRKTLPWYQRIESLAWIPRIDLQELVRRPRFSLEASFAATILWMTLFGVPTGFFIPVQAEQLVPVESLQVQQRITNMQTNLNEGVNKIPEIFSSGMDSLGTISTKIFGSGVDATQQRGREVWKSIQHWFAEFESALDKQSN